MKTTSHWREKEKYLQLTGAMFGRPAALFLAAIWRVFGKAVRDHVMLAARERLKVNYRFKGPRRDFQVICENPGMISRVRCTFLKERDTAEWIDRATEGAVLWDIGANIGMISLYAATQRKMGVIAFEPLPANLYVLTQSIIANGLDDAIKAYPLALYSKSMVGTFNVCNAAIGDAMNVFERTTDYKGEPFKPKAGIAAISFTVDECIEKWHLPRPNFIKLDVDGNELAVLEGSKKTLDSRDLKEILIELTPESKAEYNDTIRLIESFGFRKHEANFHTQMGSDGVGNFISGLSN
jgi:FkbM family methyltransferase